MINDSAVAYKSKLLYLVATIRKPKRRQLTEPTGIALFQTLELRVKAAVEAGMHRDSALAFKTLPDAASFLKPELRAGDLVLVQGWMARRLERAILAQLGSISCWVERCSKLIPCERCPELRLVRLPVPEAATGAPRDPA